MSGYLQNGGLVELVKLPPKEVKIFIKEPQVLPLMLLLEQLQLICQQLHRS